MIAMPAMFNTYEATFPIRLAIGVLIFTVLGLWDYIRHRDNPRRAKEYLFLLAATLLAIIYGQVHDHITATISRPYFLFGKGLADDPRPFRLAVSLLALRATFWVGLLVGVGLLMANNPSPNKPQLPYGELLRLGGLPIAAAAVAAGVGGLLFALAPFGQRALAVEFAGRAEATRFWIVWGIHLGSYAGGAIGAVAAMIVVRRRRCRKMGSDLCPNANPGS